MDMRGKVLTKTGTALPGVAVSNGRHICRTNDDGGFCLPYWEKSAAVFVMLLTNGQDAVSYTHLTLPTNSRV